MAASTTGTCPRDEHWLRSAVLACGIVLACGLAPAALALAPRPGEPVVVLTLLPDAPLPRAVAASGAPILWLSSGGHVAVLDGAKPGLVAELHRSGASLIIAAGPLGSCLPSARPTATLAEVTLP